MTSGYHVYTFQFSICRLAHFSEAIVAKLSKLDPDSAHHAVDLMKEKDWTRVKNIPSMIGTFIKAQELKTARDLAATVAGGQEHLHPQGMLCNDHGFTQVGAYQSPCSDVGGFDFNDASYASYNPLCEGDVDINGLQFIPF